MKALHRRVLATGERVAGIRLAATPEPSGMERWTRILRMYLPALERWDDPETPMAIARIHRTLALIAEAEASGRPWAYLEYFCHACVLRMNWPGFMPAFLDPDYDTHVTEIEGIERGRDATPSVIGSVVAVDAQSSDPSSATPAL